MCRRPEPWRKASITTTPRPIKIIRDLVAREGKDVVITRGRTADNAENLAPSFLCTIVNRYLGTRLGRQELDAEVLEDVEGSLWSWAMLEACRVEHVPEMRRIVVAIDPAVSVSEMSDATGIIVAGTNGLNAKAYAAARMVQSLEHEVATARQRVEFAEVQARTVEQRAAQQAAPGKSLMHLYQITGAI
jgi:phage terminase large subunit-like protein